MISGWEWVIILGVVVVIILWGPKKIPELARAIGRARGEFDKASKELTDAVREPPTEADQPASDDLLLETAKNLGISTAGKTKEQISKEIIESFKAAKESNS
ncbi:MAG: twin-arginine translocase TatA/TatE family subunit [Candidatus Hodarchaeota archaeon]